MFNPRKSVTDNAIIGPKRVADEIVDILTVAMGASWTLERIAEASGVKTTTIKGWMLDGKEPTLSRALSVAVVLGSGPVNRLLALIGYGGATPLDEPGEVDLRRIVSDCLVDITVLSNAAAKGPRPDHTERPRCRAAADHIIALMLPLSSSSEAA